MVTRYIGDAQWTALDADAKPTNAAVADTLTTLDTRRIFIHQGSAVWIEIGTGGTGGGGGGGGGFAAGGTIAKSGDGTSTIISIAHGLSPTPDLFYALPLNAAARGIISYGIDGTNINLTYPIAPASGSSNLSYVWGAGYVNSASGGLTPTSTTTFTGKTLDSNTNTLPNIHAAAYYTIYKVGSTYKCRDNVLGTTVSSNTVAETVIQYALTNGLRKKIYVADNTYTLSAGFTGFQFNVGECTIEFGPGVEILVPNGYTGYMFRFEGGAPLGKWHNIVINGIFNEAGTAQKLWTCFLFEGGDGGCFRNKIIDSRIRQAGKAIHLRTSGAAHWTHGNIIQDVYIDTSIVGVEFTQGAGNTGINRNRFEDIVVQAGPYTTSGFKNIAGTSNVFIDCNPWDIVGANSTANITAAATNTVIIGGIMTFANFTDAGTDTFIDDEFSKFRVGIGRFKTRAETGLITPIQDAVAPNITFRQDNTAITSFNLEYVPNSDSGSITHSWWNRSQNERMYISKAGATDYKLDIVKQTAAGAFRPLLFRTMDVPNAFAVVEYMRMDTANARMKFSAPIEIADKDIVLGTTTGTKIGTATTQKLGFFNKAPIVQPTAIAAPTGGTTIDAESRAAINSIRTALTNLGLTA